MCFSKSSNVLFVYNFVYVEGHTAELVLYTTLQWAMMDRRDGRIDDDSDDGADDGRWADETDDNDDDGTDHGRTGRRLDGRRTDHGADGQMMTATTTVWRTDIGRRRRTDGRTDDTKRH